MRSLWQGLSPLPAWRAEFAGYSWGRAQQDLLAGITVGVVALPLALAFGVSSGAGAASGIYTAIVAGFLAALLGGSRYQISGPTGAMTVVLLPIVAQYGLDKILIVGFMAGLILLALSLLRVGRLIYLIPYPVVTGFTNGIATIIFLQQVPAFLGVKNPGGDHILPNTLEAIRQFTAQPSLLAPALGLLTVAIIVLWSRWIRRMPGSLIALILVTAVAVVAGLEVSQIGQIPQSLPSPQRPNISLADLSLLFSPALAVALLAAIESLLSAVVADGMTIREKHDPDRELFGQAIANLAAPLFGGVAATGAIARTAVNVRSGGQTRLSGMVHALFLAAVVGALGPWAAHIPLTALAAILMVTAVRMIEWEAVRAIWRSTRSDLATLLITMGVTVTFDLVLAIEVGLAVAGVLFIQRMARSMSVEPMELPAQSGIDHSLLRERVLAFRIDGPLFFAVAGEFLQSLGQVANIDAVILRLRRVKLIDASGAQALLSLKQALERKGIAFVLSGLQEQPQEVLQRMGLWEELTHGGLHMFEHTNQAIAYAWDQLVKK
jgi:SulP family sulfate permease